ncbi:MAG: glycosyltransferase family 4 protein, partial [Patescibacteria group bacterium]
SNSAKITLLFSGVMFYQPNIDAALYLIREIMPKIRHKIELRIVGREPAAAVIEAAKADDRIIVTGTVQDMVAEYQAADVFIAPMISGAGIQNKILQALSCGLPVVATSMCVDAFPETPDGVLSGDTADQIANLVEKLIENQTDRKQLGGRGRMFIEKNWSWENRTERLAKMCSDVIDCENQVIL